MSDSIENEAAREEFLKSFVAAAPGYFAVFYSVHRKSLERRIPVVGWGVYERELSECQRDGSWTRVKRDVVEAMVLTNLGEAERVSNYYELDDNGDEEYRLLGIAIPGDTTDWHDEMKRDIRTMCRVKKIRREIEEENAKNKQVS